jgi:hypothetical protein
MAPLLKKEEYGRRAFFAIQPNSTHILDLIHEETRYNDRTSDLITGMLLLAVHKKIITKVEASWYAVPFTIGAKLRVSVYKHEGNPFLGPDGLPMVIGRQTFYGASPFAPASQYTFDNMETAPNFAQWLSQTLYRSTNKDDSDMSRNNVQPPKRKADGSRVSAVTLPSFTSSPAPAASSPAPVSSSSKKRKSRGSKKSSDRKGRSHHHDHRRRHGHRKHKRSKRSADRTMP